MIRNSFIFLDRINAASERNIWRQGITDWNLFLDTGRIRGISPKRKAYFDRRIIEARQHLADYDSAFFHSRFPKSEVWRMFDHFSDDCMFIDIETSGSYGDITVVGIYDGDTTHTLVKGRSLDKYNIRGILKHCKLLVSFNGQSFDVPCIDRYFNKVIPEVPHLDLRFPLAKLGFTGGLKKIEERLGIRRSTDTEGMCGEDAISLWNDYIISGDTGSLDLLVEYNTEDVINLEPIAKFVYSEMKSLVRKGVA